MANVAVIGAQWGDEGKGKIVDWLSERAEVVVRFQGGHNAGHTLVIGNQVYKLSLLPSGVVRPGKLSVIGNGGVIDPWALLKEVGGRRAEGRGGGGKAAPRCAARDRPEDPALGGAGVAAPRRGAPRRHAHPVRGRCGNA